MCIRFAYNISYMIRPTALAVLVCMRPFERIFFTCRALMCEHCWTCVFVRTCVYVCSPPSSSSSRIIIRESTEGFFVVCTMNGTQYTYYVYYYFNLPHNTWHMNKTEDEKKIIYFFLLLIYIYISIYMKLLIQYYIWYFIFCFFYSSYSLLVASFLCCSQEFRNDECVK